MILFACLLKVEFHFFRLHLVNAKMLVSKLKEMISCKQIGSSYTPCAVAMIMNVV